MAAKDGSRRSYTDAERQKALDLYIEVGPAEASRRTGVPAATIRSWALRAGATVARPRTQAATAAVEAARLTWAQRRAEVAALASEVAIDSGRRALGAKPREASDLMRALRRPAAW